jgi:hypothetical protein
VSLAIFQDTATTSYVFGIAFMMQNQAVKRWNTYLKQNLNRLTPITIKCCFLIKDLSLNDACHFDLRMITQPTGEQKTEIARRWRAKS